MDKSPDSNLDREGGALQRIIEQQRTRIAELERSKTWLEEQWLAWKETAEARERSIQELKAWIDQLEAGKTWLEKDRQYWKGVALERKIGIYGLVLRAARRLFPGVKKEERSDLATATDVQAQKAQASETERQDLKLQRKAGSAEARALILLYHSIMPPMSDPWSLCVSPEHFEGHLQAIQEWGTPLHLDELIDRLTSGTLPPNAVALTFDDGYASILSQARPLLEQYEVPATMFVTTAALAEAREFWWDELERIFLQPGNLPPMLELEIDGHHFRWDLGDAASYTPETFAQNLSWRAAQPAGTRQQLYTELWELLHSADPRLIREIMDKLFDWACLRPEPRPTHRLITWDEVTDFKDDPWIKFGSHALTHASLASLPAEKQAYELRQSKTSLETATGRRVTSLAYPYGLPRDYSIETAALAREAGYKMALINSPGPVNKNVDLFHLPRFYVDDWEKEEFSRHLLQWTEE